MKVWIDSGSGPGHDIEVHAEHLALSPQDDGFSAHAVYSLRVASCEG